MFANPILLFTLFTQILAKESNTGEQDQLITGWLNERLDLDCLKKRIQNEEEFVARGLSEAGKGLKPFVSSKWDQRIRNYTKICNKDHSMYLLCLTQVSSYVTNDQVTHFYIESASADLDGRRTVCEYGSIDSSGPSQTIIIRGRIKEYVNGRIEMKCPIRHRCNETDTVTLKMNLTEVMTADFSQENKPFHCRENDQYYDVCRDHMNSSYVNGSCRVIFVFEKTPVYLNNTPLHCHVKFRHIEVDPDHDDIETIIFLQYQPNESTTAPPTHKKISNENATNTTPKTTPTHKGSVLTLGVKIGIGFAVAVVIFIIIIGSIIYWQWEQIVECISRYNGAGRLHAVEDDKFL